MPENSLDSEQGRGNASGAEVESAWSNVRALLVDLDGTLYQGDQPIPGAAEALAALEARGILHCYVTNVTSRPLSAIVAQLSAMGIEVEPERIFSAPRAAREYLLKHDLRRCHFLVRPQLLEDFHGIEVVGSAGADETDADAEQGGEATPDAVVIGDLGDGFIYERLNRAFRMILEGAQVVTLARNRFFRAADGLSLDVGPFVSALEYAADVQATLVGKPAPEFFQPALDYLGVSAAEAAMIGDDIEGDVGGGQAAGVRGILVRTGKFREDVLARSSIKPDAVIDSLADIGDLIQG